MAANTKATNTKVSIGELKRRWQATRRMMKEHNLDFLLFQNSHSFFHGYLKWFTDMTCPDAYPSTVIFPRDEDMTIITHGSRPMPGVSNPPGGSLPGVKKRMTLPMILSMSYTKDFDAEVIAKELAPYKYCRIGIVGMSFMSAFFYKYVTEHLSTAKFEDVTDLVDEIKAVKSDEEIDFIKGTCRLEDKLWDYALTLIKPGVTTSYIRRALISKNSELGAEYANIAVGAAPAGTPAIIMLPDRILQAGDQFVALIETDGPGGYWGELTRTACLGKVSPELELQFELAKQAQKLTVDLLKPGTPAGIPWDANNAFLRSKRYPEEGRVYAHAQGYDMVERPALDNLEKMRVQANTMFAVHPMVWSDKAVGWICDNYLVTGKSPPLRLHKTAQKIFVL
jgi:Xaa-Pro aminopeptidase